MAMPSPITSKPLTQLTAMHENICFRALGINNFSHSYRLLNQKQFGHSFSEFGKGFAKCLGIALIIYGLTPLLNTDPMQREMAKLSDCLNQQNENCQETLNKYLSLSSQNPAIACATTNTKTCEKIIGFIGTLDDKQFNGIRESVVDTCMTNPKAILECKNLLDKILDEEFNKNATNTAFNLLFVEGESNNNQVGPYNIELAEDYFKKIIKQEPVDANRLDAFFKPCLEGRSNSASCQLTMNYAFDHFSSINHAYAEEMKKKCIDQVNTTERRNLGCESLLEHSYEKQYKSSEENFKKIVKQEPVDTNRLNAFLEPCIKGYSNSDSCQKTFSDAFDYFSSINHAYAAVMRTNCTNQVLKPKGSLTSKSCENLFKLPCEQLYKNNPGELLSCKTDPLAIEQMNQREKEETL